MASNRVEIRLAKTEDAEGILRAHYSAIHHTATRDYPVEITSEWSTPVTAERIERYLKDSFPAETTVVAIVDSTVAGFGSIVEPIHELRAVYVASEFGGQGIGGAILQRLEELARKSGCPELKMDSSLTAERFYLRHGYEVIERGFHVLRSGGRMACVKMRKPLE